MNSTTVFENILRPAGGGVYVVSTGVAEQRALQQAVYGVQSADEIGDAWRAALGQLSGARVALLGVPSDTGAGFVRGANQGPSVLRQYVLKQPAHAAHATDVVDAGDVRVVPQLLSDEMLSPAQIRASRAALYGDPDFALPVSPLDLCDLALDRIYARNPRIVPIVLGGDHSVGWPAFSAAFRHWEQTRGHRLGLLHFDAHTDLLETRLGVKYCFATWAWHANKLLGGDGRLVQVGIRASGRERAHWEQSLGVRQYWSEEVRDRDVNEVSAEIIAHFEQRGVDALYVSNDIDGTDIEFAAATGTPEAGGLHPNFVRALTRAVAERFPLVGADLVEVAPPLGVGRPGEPERTLNTAVGYLNDLVELARSA